MDFNVNINGIFTDIVTKVDNRLQVCRNATTRFQDARLQLFDIINKMGEASARAQGLAGAITTGRKLEMSEHHLYLMKDPEGSRGMGSVVGILKIGRKRLFVYDRHGQQWEMNPLCVLDFYVHESRQRMGCGRRLFDFMLKDQNTCPQHLAVDRPSHKFASFLAKHYNLRTEIPQVNNFVIFDGFFTKRPAEDFVNNRSNSSNVQPADYPQAETEMRGSRQNNYSNSNYNRNHTAGMPTKMDPRGSNSNSRMGVAGPHHHQNQLQQDSSLRDLNLNPRSANNSSSSGNGMSPRGLSDVDFRGLSAGSSSDKGARAAMQLQASMYSRHQVAHSAEKQRPSGSNNPVKSASDSRIVATTRGKSPPLLQRDGPPSGYPDLLNMHQNYQGRGGHLVVPPAPRPDSSKRYNSTTTPMAGAGRLVQDSSSIQRPAYTYGYYTNPELHTTGDTSWTVFGVMRNQQHMSARAYGSGSKMWR